VFVLVASVAAAHTILSLVCFAFGFLVTLVECFDFLSEILNLSILLLWMEPIMWTYFQREYIHTDTHAYAHIYCT